MKNILKNILVFTLLATVLVCTNSTKASAGRDKPKETDVWNLVTQGIYNGKGSATTVPLYSNYFFTGAKTLKVSVENLGAQKLTVEIYRSDSSVCYYRYKVPAGEGHIFWLSSNPNKKYYFKFKKPCNFKWWVKAG